MVRWERVGCRERKAGWYSTASWVAHRMVEELAFCAVYSAVLACVLFFSMRLHGSFAAFWNPYFLSFCFGIGAYPLPTGTCALSTQEHQPSVSSQRSIVH